MHAVSRVACHALLPDFREGTERRSQSAIDVGILCGNRETARGAMHGGADGTHMLRHELGHVGCAMRLQRDHTEAVFGYLGCFLILLIEKLPGNCLKCEQVIAHVLLHVRTHLLRHIHMLAIIFGNCGKGCRRQKDNTECSQ